MFTGAILEDTRPVEEKARDYHALELGLGQKTVWRNIDINNYSHPAFPNGVKEQGASTCGAHVQANILQVLEYKETGNTEPLSCAMPYLFRDGNYEGTSIYDVLTTLRKHGTTYESLMPSQHASDEKVLSYKPTSTDTAIGGFLSAATVFKLEGFDSLTEYLEGSRVNGVCNPAAILSRHGGSRDWQRAVVDVASPKTFGHWYTAVDYGVVDGQECIIIADSWRNGTANQNGFRAVPREYITKYMNAILGVTDKQNAIGTFEQPIVKPVYNLKTWKFGDKDCQELQRFLADKGFFPQTQSQTGLYGNITAGAVKKWQIANNVTTLAKINEYEGKYFGNLSLKVALN